MTFTPFLMRIHLLKNIEVECATILRKNPRLRLLKGILFWENYLCLENSMERKGHSL